MSARRRRRRARRAGWAVVLVLVVLVAGVGTVIAVLNTTHPAAPVAERCEATIDGTAWALSPDQADNAALVGAVAVRRQLPARAATIGLATALQESKLINVEHGDRDSLGLFQQRPSQGWGTPEQVQDPVFATGTFYDHLVKVDGYEDLPITEAAQAVQRSGYPEAYAQHEARARAWASSLTGWSPGALTCTLHDAGTGSGDAVTERVQRDLGDLPVVATPTDDGTTLTIDTAPLGAEADRLGWAVAQWAVAVASPLQLTSVSVADQTWDREAGEWAATEGASVPTGTVQVTIAG